MSKSFKVNGIASSSVVWRIDIPKKQSSMVDNWKYKKRHSLLDLKWFVMKKCVNVEKKSTTQNNKKRRQNCDFWKVIYIDSLRQLYRSIMICLRLEW